MKHLKRALLATLILGTMACNSNKSEKPAAAPEPETPKPVEAPQPAENTQDSKPVELAAKVNGVEITRADFDERYNKTIHAFTTRNKEVPPAMAKRYRQSTLRQLIDQELLRQRIEAAKIKVNEVELNQELAEYKELFRTEENFQRYLKGSSATLQQIELNLSQNVAINKLVALENPIDITADELKKFYDENIARYTIKEQVHAFHILIKVDPDSDAEAQKKAREKINEIYGLATQPDADLNALAREHSEGPTSTKGGDLGKIPRGRMVPEFDEIAFALKIGEISKPVQSKYGWHIVWITEHEDGRVLPFEEVKPKIEKLITGKKNRQNKAGLLQRLNKEANIEILLDPELLPSKDELFPTTLVNPNAAAGEPAAPTDPAAEPTK